MLNKRQIEIVKMITEKYSVKNEELAAYFQVSDETIRRDLKCLENMHILKRIHGGAISGGPRLGEEDLEQREIRNNKEKMTVAIKAAEIIKDGESLAISNGTSTHAFARALKDKKNLTVFTNSLIVAQELAENETNQVYIAGGCVRKNSMGASGSATIDFLKGFYVDKAVISIGGISKEQGVTDFDVEESAVLRTMLGMSAQNVILTDYSKLTRIGLNKICNIEDIDILVSDWRMPVKEQEFYKNAGIRLILTDREEISE